MNQQETSDLKKAGKIAQEVVKYAKSIIKPSMPLLEIAEKIESNIEELGGKPAFPANLCINDIAAHDTPSYNDERKASGLLKIDIGVHVNGQIADTAFSLDLENSEENKKLIQASQEALESALKVIKKDIELWKIGHAIQQAIEKQGFSPIRNLSGHELKPFRVHAGLTIPNYNNNSNIKIEEGSYAIEPFATTGQGIIYEGKSSGIYKFEERKAVRDSFARQILDFIEEKYKTLPFCARWLVKKFGTRALLALRNLEQAKIIYQFPQLIEKSHQKVSQAEHTILIEKNKTEIMTK